MMIPNRGMAMRKHLGTVLWAMAAVLPALAFGGEDPARTPAAASAARETRISAAFYFREVDLDLRDGTALRGRLVGATAASIRVGTRDGEEEFALRDIRRIVIHSERQRSKGIVPGIVFGLYAGNLLALGSDRGPGFYLKPRRGSSHSDWILLEEAFFGIMGGGLGWLTPFGGARGVFEFPAAGDDPGALERFGRFLAGEPPPARVHFLLQNGFLLAGVRGRFGAFAADNGFAADYPWPYPTSFSLLRSLEISLTIRPRLRTGLRVSFPSEPAFYYYMRHEGTAGSFTSLDQAHSATALHAVGVLELAGWKSRTGFAASLGAGAGMAWVRLTRNALTVIVTPDPIPPSYEEGYVHGSVGVRKTLPSAVVFGNVRYRLTPVVSIGLVADFTFVSAVTVPALPDNNVPGGSMGLSSGSLGFLVGYHF